MPTEYEIRGYDVGTTYKEPFSVLPPGSSLNGVLPIVYSDSFVVRSQIIKVDKKKKEVTLEVIDKRYGTPCRKLGTNQGWGNNLCSATDRPCTGRGLEEACNVFGWSEKEKEIIRGGKKSNTKIEAGQIVALDPLDFQ